ncbi:hypothetical protein Q428_00085 [Fervidicella metallireducens AeB]|uniref:Uncharacterized protein n=1 Tax=Fervidicella metallireducens AeB TaxID=1403537 RepID=A0A017RZ36_9CLOT|nr:hypothetical protein [Fervidicella metallireducens]EYE89851.1 hypothetical protein Q428_00085 [Fervidicella metallireducens AeB]
MIFKPDEVANLKKGRTIHVEIKEGDVRVLKRNFCGVYELFPEDNSCQTEYFEDLNLFKNRYGNVHKKFPLYNICKQRLDIYPVAEEKDCRYILKWFSEYGKIIYQRTKTFAGLDIDYYIWISDMENTISSFQVVKDDHHFTLSIGSKNIVNSLKYAI